MKGKLVYFTEDQYQKLVEASRTILKGRRGSHSRKWRIRKKLVNEAIDIAVSKMIEELGND